MKNHIYAIALISLITTIAGAGWQNLELIQENAEKPHATMMVYPDANSAMSLDRTKSPWFNLLNGDWKFQWSKSVNDKPEGFQAANFNDSAWKTIPVPSNWQIHGYGIPIYTNSKYPFNQDAPKIDPAINPVGSYRMNFDLPKSWDGRRTLIHFDGVNSCMYLWVNGVKVGYSEGSRTPAEFDITKYVKPGKNILAAQVYRWCDGSYMEDQDFWRLAGIFRDVYLWSVADQHIRDFKIDAALVDGYKDGRITVTADIVGAGAADFELLDADGTKVVAGTVKAGSPLVLALPGVKSWSAERPDLYTALLSLKKEGKVVEVIPTRVGFRTVEIKDGIFYVNGVKIKFKGVNRHETHPDLGQGPDRAAMLQDIKLFKENNINAVRTCHYANAPLWYELCDIYGIWVLAEANIETHGYGNRPGNKLATEPEWKEVHVDRVRRMAERDKNHPSVVVWSLGNEAGVGPNFDACYEYLHANHSERPVHYEGDKRKGNPASDFLSKMYANQDWGRTPVGKPMVLCEYTHAMGNSNGNLDEYWHGTIYKHDCHSGGFVWDWMDQGIRTAVPEQYMKNIGVGPVKETFFAYGGWFEDKHGIRHDGNFCMNGLVSSDWTPHPGLFAIKYAYRNIHVAPIDLASGKFKVKSWFDTLSIDEVVEGRWVVEENGKEIAKGQIDGLDIPARGEKDIAIKVPSITPKPGAVYYLTLRFTAKKAYSDLVDAGHELAFAQFKLPVEKLASAVKPASLGPVALKEDESSISIKGVGFELIFDKSAGTIASYSVKGEELLKRGPKIDLWRAYTDNDKAPINKGSYGKVWRDAAASEKISDVTVEKFSTTAIRISVKSTIPTVNSECKTVYTVYGSGEVDVDVGMNIGSAAKQKYPHRLGTELLIPGGYETITWFGRGPNPTYIDRKFERIGLFSGTVDEQWVDYSRPQANGNKVDVRWVTMTDAKGNGLLFSAEGAPLSVGAKHYSKETIEKCKYSFEMERSEDIFLNIDHKQLGVGGNNSWGQTALDAYQLKDRQLRYSYRMRPVKAGDDVETLLNSAVEAQPVSFDDLKVPAAPATAAISGKFSASSAEKSKGNTPEKAFDGNPGTRWCAANGQTPQWVATDLGKKKQINGVDVTWEDVGPYTYTVQVSLDGKGWKSVASSNKKGNKQSHSFKADARYIKVHCTKLPPKMWVSISELKVR